MYPSKWFPNGLFSGIRAMTTQSYVEANVKNGVQYELALEALAVLANGNVDTLFTTGNVPVLVKARQISFNGIKVEARVYRSPTFSGGSVVPYFNLNDRNPVAGTVVIRSGATISAVGTEFGAPTFAYGSEGQGNSVISTFQLAGSERLLAPNTTYMLRVTNKDTSAKNIAAYLTWYEGNTDLPK